METVVTWTACCSWTPSQKHVEDMRGRYTGELRAQWMEAGIAIQCPAGTGVPHREQSGTVTLPPKLRRVSPIEEPRKQGKKSQQ